MKLGSRAGFTLIEVAIVIVLLSIALPILFGFMRTIQIGQHRALGRAESVRALRTISEEIRRDLRVLRWEDTLSLAMVGPGKCKRIEYRVDQNNILLRIADPGCGSTRPIARNVETVRRTEYGLEVVFSRRIGARDPAEYRLEMGMLGVQP